MTQILERTGTPYGVSRTEPPRPQPRKFRPDIEGLRAFAVLSVVLYHAGLGIRGGFVGVDVFFVISGFLITRQLLDSVDAKGIRSLPTFYTRRLRRLLPASIVVVIATVLASRIWAPALQVKSISVDALYTTFYGLNYRLAATGTQYLHETDAVSPLQHFWSLGVEEQFYVFWPIIIVALAVIGRRFRRALLVALLVATIVISFHYSVVVTKSSAPWAYFSLHTRAWELALGALVAVCGPALARLPRRLAEITATAGLIGMIVSAFAFSAATAYPGSAAALPVVGTALVIAAGTGRARRIERLLAEPMMQCIGRVSYSWYLWHWPMLILAPSVVGHPLNWVQRVFVIWLSLTLAVLSYFIVEDPVRHLKLSNVKWFGNGLLMSGVVALSCVLVMTHLPSLVGSGAAVTVVQADTATAEVTKQMQDAVAAGVNTTNVPSNLTPQPAKAASDTPASSKNGCHADFLSVTQGACVFGDPAGTHTAVLFGDSHMEQWLPAFMKAGAHEHWKIVNWTKAACSPAQLTVFAPTLNRDYTECYTWRDATLKRIAALKPDIVFMSQSENVVTSKLAPADFTRGTIATLDILRNTTKSKVVYLNDIPVPNYDAPTCIAEHLSNAKDCNFAVKNAYIYPSRHKAMQPAIAKAGYAVVDPRDWLCTKTTCPAVVGNYLVYRNTTHISASMSQWLTPMVAPLLKATS